MKRREFFGNLLGLMGVVTLPLVSASAATVSGEEFTLDAFVLCPNCGSAMYPERDEKGVTFQCTNVAVVYPAGFTLDGRAYSEICNPGCPRTGIKYRAPKIRMERVK